MFLASGRESKGTTRGVQGESAVRTTLLTIQVGTYAGLGLLLLRTGRWQLGCAQLLLGAVQWLVFSS